MDEFKELCVDEDKMRAYYSVGNLNLKGYASGHLGDGLYRFNTQERMDQGKPDLLVSASDIKIVIRYEE